MQKTPSEDKQRHESVAVISTDEQKMSLPEEKQEKVNKALFILPASLALIMTGFGIIIPVFPQRLEALGLGSGTLALMEGAFGLGTFLFSTPMGILANRIGRKPLVLLALIGFIVTNVLLAFVNTPVAFILVRFLEGALVAGFMPVSMAMVGDMVPMAKQGRWLGVMTTAQAGGIALGPAIGGVLYQSWGFSSPFLLSAGFALIASLLAILLLPETLPEQLRLLARERKADRKLGIKKQKVKLAGPGFMQLLMLFAPLLFIDFGVLFVFPFSLPQYPFFFENVLFYTAAQYGLIISAYGLSLAVFPLFLGRLTEKMSKKLLVVLGCLLSAALNLGMLLVHQYPLLIASSLITGLGSALLTPALGAIYLNASNDENRAQLMGVRSTAISLALLVAPLAQAVAGSWITPHITFAIATAISALVTVFALVALKNPRPQAPNVDRTMPGKEVASFRH